MIGYAECEVANINGFPMQNFYSKAELEFLSEESKEVTIQDWVARDRMHGDLYLYSNRPRRAEKGGYWIYGPESGTALPIALFPEVTWDTEPKRVKITITPIEE